MKPPKERRTSFADADEGENEKALRSKPFASPSSGDGGSPLLGRDGSMLCRSPGTPTSPSASLMKLGMRKPIPASHSLSHQHHGKCLYPATLARGGGLNCKRNATKARTRFDIPPGLPGLHPPFLAHSPVLIRKKRCRSSGGSSMPISISGPSAASTSMVSHETRSADASMA